MSATARTQDPIDAIALLGDPNRRRLYELVTTSTHAVGRDDAAAALGISRELAAFHLDRLVAGGLLETEFRRRSGRSGPGAGRPAKLYRRSARELDVSLPPREYERAAGMFADALDRLGEPASDAVESSARARGLELGRRARQEAGAHPRAGQSRAVLLELLRVGGFEPIVDPSDGTVRLRNCPYRVLSEGHRDLTCGMNLAWASGVVAGLDAKRLEVELDPQPGACCVAFRDAASGVSSRSGRGTGR